MVAAAQDTAVLFASTAFVIVPDLVFVIFIERMGVNWRLANGCGHWGLDAAIKSCLSSLDWHRCSKR